MEETVRMKTALQQLIEFGEKMMEDHPPKVLSFCELLVKAADLIDVEKEQIKDAWRDGMEGILHEIAAEQYYNETYVHDTHRTHPSSPRPQDV